MDFRELLRNPKKLAIMTASGIAYFLIRRQFPENIVVDAATAGGAYYASKRTAGDIKTALEGVALGAGANLALTLAKKAPEAFAAALPTGAPQPQIVVQVPGQAPPLVQVTQTVTQAQQVSQQLSQMVSQLQEQLQQMGRQLEQIAQQSPAQTMPTKTSPDFTLPVEPRDSGDYVTLPVEPSEPSDAVGGVGITYYTTSGQVYLLE